MPEFLTNLDPIVIVIAVVVVIAGAVLWMKKEGKGPFGQ